MLYSFNVEAFNQWLMGEQLMCSVGRDLQFFVAQIPGGEDVGRGAFPHIAVADLALRLSGKQVSLNGEIREVPELIKEVTQ
jgi:hypothetical protein